jgi:hypothetical protein
MELQNLQKKGNENSEQPENLKTGEQKRGRKKKKAQNISVGYGCEKNQILYSNEFT